MYVWQHKSVPQIIIIFFLHVLAHHGDHEVEQPYSLHKGETQNGVRKQLTTHARVTGNLQNFRVSVCLNRKFGSVAARETFTRGGEEFRDSTYGHQEGCENHSDTYSRSSQSDSSRPHTDVLRHLDHGRGDFGGVCAGGLTTHHVAGGGVEDFGYLLALHRLEGRFGIEADALARTYHHN
jgi:hypothetical protein